MKVSDFYYFLPEELIAQTPIKDRSASRLLVVDKVTGEYKHEHFYYIKKYLKPGDCLVLNDTRVIPARLYGVKEGTESPMEFVLLKRHTDTDWEVLVRPGKRAKIGARFDFGEGALKAEVIDIIEEDGNRIVRFEWEGIFEEVLDKIGVMPLPPCMRGKEAVQLLRQQDFILQRSFSTKFVRWVLKRHSLLCTSDWALSDLLKL